MLDGIRTAVCSNSGCPTHASVTIWPKIITDLTWVQIYFFECGIFSVITDVVLAFCEPSSPHNSQRIDGNQQHNEDNTYCHMIIHAHTTKHNQTQTYHKHNQTQHPFPAQMQAHFIPSGTRLAQLYQDSCFVHDRNMFAQTGNEPKYRHSDILASQSRVCTQRARLDE